MPQPFPVSIVSDFEDATLNFEFLASHGIFDTSPPHVGAYFAGAGKTTVVDGDFTVTPGDGMVAVHFDSTAVKTYLSVRANGSWHVMAGPV